MFDTEFYQTHKSEAFVASQCLQHEHAVANFFSSILQNLGYTTTDFNRRIWERHEKIVVVCLTDDFNICGADFSKEPPKWFSPNTTVITDNKFLGTAEFKIIQLPASYFGVFGYTPAMQLLKPDRRFHLSINRLDAQRQLILFELIKQSNGIASVIKDDYINFNAYDPCANNSTKINIQDNFARHWDPLALYYSKVYDQFWNELVEALPLRNHNLSIEDAGLKAYLNLVVETYAGNTTITFSEKTFRALVSPAPWTLFAAHGAVSYLQQLGFDVLADIIDHSYDFYTQDIWPGNSKIANYISVSIDNYHRLTQIPLNKLVTRCTKAAYHNQQLLQSMRTKFPSEFACWLPGVIAQLE